MDTIKTIIITLLVIVGMVWFVREGTEDPDYVVLEYQCSKLGTYEDVPNEVTEECTKRKAKIMAILYRIKPADKKSVEAFYDVYKKMPDGTIRGWSVTELYRWGQGFVEDESELPFSDDRYHCVDPTIGWGCELEDLCAVDFEFDDSFTDEEKAEIEELWANGDPNDEYERSGAAWLYDYSEWEVEEDTITILGPFTVDKIDEDVYNEVIETIELKPRPPFVATTAWPFSTATKED